MKKVAFGAQTATPGYGYHLDRARSLMTSIKRELEMCQNRPISYEELGQWAGQAGSTAFDKFQKMHQPQIELLLRWLERLPESTRNRALNGVCRCFPTLTNPRLNHDPVQVGRVKRVLHRATGITAVRGATESARTFVLTALGHDFEALRGPSQFVAGMDVHEPDWFVPIGDVIYFPSLLDPAQLREGIQRKWPLVAASTSRFVIFNGIWGSAQEVRAQIAGLAADAHVVIADDFGSKPDNLGRGSAQPVQWLTLSEEADGRIRIAG